MWLVPQVFETLVWNAYFPIPFLVATIVVAWVVCMGGYGWWPVLVATGSIAAQTHLFFVLPCVPLVIVAPIAALWVAGRPHRIGWLDLSASGSGSHAGWLRCSRTWTHRGTSPPSSGGVAARLRASPSGCGGGNCGFSMAHLAEA